MERAEVGRRTHKNNFQPVHASPLLVSKSLATAFLQLPKMHGPPLTALSLSPKKEEALWIPPWFSAGRAGWLPTPEGSRTNVCAALADFFSLPKAKHYITGPQGLRQISWWGKRERERE